MTQTLHNATARPWYREMWPWLLMLPPAFAVAGGVAMVVLAVRTPGVLSVDDYSRIEELTGDRFARDREAARLGLSAELHFADDARSIELVLDSATSAPLPTSVTLMLQHVTDSARDLEIVLLRDADSFTATSPLRSGRYHIELMNPERTWRLGATALLPESSVLLEPQTDGA